MSDIGGLKPGTNLGEEAKPPFAVLPDPFLLFLNRSRRFAALAPQSDLAPYLRFLSTLTQAQHEVQAELPATTLPPTERMSQALEHGMPPVSRPLIDPARHAACAGWVEARRTQSLPARLLRRSSERLS
jgi:formate dehydrogenase accessory protein FdhE